MCNIGQEMETCVVDIPNSSVWSNLFQLVIENRERPGRLAEERGLVQFRGAKFREPTNAEASCKEFYT